MSRRAAIRATKGRPLRRELEDQGILDDTIIIYLQDNGGCAELPEGADFPHPAGPKEHYTSCGPGWGWAQNAPFRRFKTWTYEGGIATPMIVRWPGKVAPGAITHQVGHVVDFLPTLLELAEAEYPARFNDQALLPVEGKSLIPVFHGTLRQGHESLSWELYGNRAIRQGDWKLVWGAGDKVWELYDLTADRSETRNLASQYPERVTAMARDWESWWETVQ